MKGVFFFCLPLMFISIASYRFIARRLLLRKLRKCDSLLSDEENFDIFNGVCVFTLVR